MSRYTIKRLARKLYRDSYQNIDGYHEIHYEVENDKVQLAFLTHNSWSMDRSELIGTMPGRITPSRALEIAEDMIHHIEKEEKARVLIE